VTISDLCPVEAAGSGVQCGQELFWREAPIIRKSSLGVLAPSVRRCAAKEAGEGFHSDGLVLTVLRS